MLKHKLIVKRRLSSGHSIKVGELAENKTGIYFQYDETYRNQYSNLSPFALQDSSNLQLGPKTPHNKLHGVFADSLPDGWGLYLMDRIFRKCGYDPRTISQLERLAFIGDNCLGALYYEPVLDLDTSTGHDISIQELGKQAIEEFEGTESALIEHLMNTAGSGGARPKINATLLADGSYTTNKNANGTPCLIKLTSNNFYLKHEESLVEYCCMQLANQCGIETAEFDLINTDDGKFWLRQNRFDCTNNNGRLHMVSASGLLDASFREPSLDYVDLIKATRAMCGVEEAKKIIQRALFNYLICNQDDHAKNFAFLCDDSNNWRLSPFYDVVYSPSPYSEHMTAFNGDGVMPNHVGLNIIAKHAGTHLKHVQAMATEIMDTLVNSRAVFQNVELSSSTINTIVSTIDKKWQQLSKQW